ncbi:heat shock protein hsp20 [Candidatus Vecturithrix granuli]|uniref:Heat shock protein hsp20 n=1 Tax=Vecturithrix granuli TaxID=1499967 RepID=A0A081C8K3_VECG1|nr:heat shock protein hsp20 [Candidatus Vecturithrix granuli]
MLEKLAKWNPLKSVRAKGEHNSAKLKELGQLQDALNRLFDRFFQDRYTESEDALWFPAVDMAETDTAIVIHAELPGMTKKDVDISLQDNILTIQGEKKRKKKAKHEDFYLVERSFGRFYQAFTLPAAVKSDKITATFKHGVLTITLPKSEGAQPKRIAISTS